MFRSPVVMALVAMSLLAGLSTAISRPQSAAHSSNLSYPLPLETPPPGVATPTDEPFPPTLPPMLTPIPGTPNATDEPPPPIKGNVYLPLISNTS